jgi:hypothetical protein
LCTHGESFMRRNEFPVHSAAKEDFEGEIRLARSNIFMHVNAKYMTHDGSLPEMNNLGAAQK